MSTFDNPQQTVADRQRCPCRSGAAYKRCCKRVVRFRRRALRELLAQACDRKQEQSIGARALLHRFRLHLARRDQDLAVSAWLKSDMIALGYELDGSGGWGWTVNGLSWKATTTTPSGKKLWVDGRLQRALTALQQGADDAALDELLRYWQRRRRPVIADLVDKLCAVCGVGQLPKDWPKRLSDGLRQLEALAARGADPRVAVALVDLFCKHARPYAGEIAEPFWELAFETWQRCGDLRTWGRMRQANGCRPNFPKSEELLEHATPLEQEEAEMLSRIEEALDARAPRRQLTAEDFLQRIYRDPADDALRQVYADWLLERDDPRGELIALQTQPRQTEQGQRRIATLLDRHGWSWLGPLAAVTRLSDVRFERGFVSACSCQGSRDLLVEVTGAACWATVEQVTFRKTEPANRKRARVLAGLLGDRAMRSLRSVRGLQPPVVRTVAELGGLKSVEELVLDDSWRFGAFDAPQRSLVPRLTHLDLGATSSQSIDDRLLDWLPRLSVTPPDGLLVWQRRLRDNESLRCFRYRMSRAELELTRGADGQLSALRVCWPDRTKEWTVKAVIEELHRIDPQSLTQLVFEPTNRLQVTSAHRGAFRALRARFTRLQKLRLPWEWKRKKRGSAA